MHDDDQLNDYWRRYKDSEDADALDELVRHYEPLARFYARRSWRKAPAHQPFEDLLSSAYRGLLEAAQRFEPGRGLKFETFASRRIAGAIIDAQRRDDPLSRSARQRVNGLREAQRELWDELGRRPTYEELAERLGMSVDDVRDLHFQQQTLTEDLEKASEVSSDHEDPHLNELAEQAAGHLAAKLSRLAERERTFVELYYGAGHSLKEVGRRLGCSDSRCAQVRRDVLVALLSEY